MVHTVIFDMDGILIDSEPLWGKALTAAFAKIDVSFTPAMHKETQGMAVPDLVEYWFSKLSLNSENNSLVQEYIWEEIVSFVKAEGVAIDGAYHALDFFKGLPVTLGLASSSRMLLVDIVLDKLGMREYFSAIHSAEFEKRGKPAPDVYLGIAHKLGVNPTECLAIEDSVNGVQGALSAGMKCIAVPDEHHRNDPRFRDATLILSSLQEVNADMWASINQ